MHDADQRPLRGVVEIDETYVGGERLGVGRGYVDNKSVVIAAVERDGDVRMRVVPDRGTRSVAKFVRENVHEDAEAVFTDEARVYPGVLKDRNHESVKHGGYGSKARREWVRGRVHTNTVEGVHSLLKRSIIGSFHHMSKKHLPAYVDEIEWRYNNRKNPYLFRDTMVELLKTAPMEYEKLTA